MDISNVAKVLVLAAVAALVAGCGGSSSNASPGSVVVEVPVTDPGGGGGGGGGGTPPPSGGAPVASVIPAALNTVISDSGTTAPAAFDNKPIFNIDVSALTNGQLDPAGLVIGNDSIFQVSGGALRITPPAGTPAPASGDGKDVELDDGSGTASASQLPECQWEIAPGAIIVGETAEDFIVIEQDCAIIADGTDPDSDTGFQPIVFTALAEINGTAEDDDRGLWGGLVINGTAPINDCPEGVEGGTAECVKEGEANSGTFGGADANDHSGILRYVSVRYAGSFVDTENQLNGIAFQGVGDETEIEYVQVHNNLDDGIEFFGGTANARYVVLTGNADDSLDWTDGWNGSIQYLYIEQTNSADHAIEADNREGDEDLLPRSDPKIANMTVLGKSDERALRIRRGTGLTLSNSFVDGSDSCVRVDGRSRDFLGGGTLETDGDVIFQGVSLACANTTDTDDDGAVATYLAGATNVSTTGDSVDPVVIGDSFFEDTDYIGAFGATDWTEGWTLGGSVSAPTQPDFGCPAGTTASAEVIDGQRVCQLSGTITSDLLLTANNLYQLIGKVQIGDDNSNSAVLTLQAGATVFGTSPDTFLQISRGSQIIANGTRTAPVVFTADEDVRGLVNVDTDRGLWGGLVINGNAPINDCPEGQTGGTAGCTKEGEANSGTFGGSQPEDSSGVLNYVSVRYAGSFVDTENQLNGIAFQGVGSGTEVDFVQVHNNLDDGIEFFGGTVNASHIVLTGNADDSLDWTDGWSGSVQYLIIDQSDDSADNGIEADNREGDETAEPRALPSIANMTLTGIAGERGVYLRRGTGLELYNSIVQGSDNCLRVAGDSLNQLGTGIQFGGVTFDCATVIEGDDVPAIQAELDASENVAEDGTLVVPVDLSANEFFDDAPFVGAIQSEADDWTLGWTIGMPSASADFPCPAGTTEVTSLDGTTRTCSLAGTYTADLALARNNIYVLDGRVAIGGDNVDPASLSIESGTRIVGDDPEDFILISRGSQIWANGTQNAPITFTASDDILGNIADPATTRGLWGGLVINGNAPINDCPEGETGGTAACIKEGEANSGTFGGDQPNDNSGRLRYVVVKFAGSFVDTENQLNGIAFQGVGDATEVDFIEVFNNLDDGIEFFGGTVNASHVVLVGNADDSLDWTDGWTGVMQFVHIQQSADSADNGIEADNREGDELLTPVSEPTIANKSILGVSGERGVYLRRGTGLQLWNSEVSGSDNCLRIAGESLNLLGTGITFQGVTLDCTTAIEGDDVPAIQTFIDGSTNVTTDGSAAVPVTLPDSPLLDADGSDVVGSNVDDWGDDWTVGLD